MITILSALANLLSFRVRRRASLELEPVALRHQVTVLRRQRPGQLRLFGFTELGQRSSGGLPFFWKQPTLDTAIDREEFVRWP